MARISPGIPPIARAALLLGAALCLPLPAQAQAKAEERSSSSKSKPATAAKDTGKTKAEAPKKAPAKGKSSGGSAEKSGSSTKNTKAADKPVKSEEKAKKAEKAEKAEEAAPGESSSDDGASGTAVTVGALQALEAELAELQGAPVGPRKGSGQRSVPEKPGAEATPAPETEPPAGDPEPAPSPARKPTHQKGAPPRKPQATLPAGVPLPEPDGAARRGIAGGPTADELRLGTDDPELRALRDAERVLFPKPLEGVEPGWSWDLPRAAPSGRDRVSASGVPPSPVAPSESGAQELAAESAWLKTLAMPNLPVRLDPRVVKYLLFYRDNPRGKGIARVWAKKSGRYVQAMKVEFAKAGLPTDLVWMSLIESGHTAVVYSPAGAAGLWQFMPDAGRLYGLTVDRWVDERLDPQRSTEAAIRYLSDLHRRFGNWELAMAAYNMGYGGLARAIRKFNTNDFWQLARYEAGIPWETTLYVPKIFATAILMNNKKAFGIDGIEPEAAIRFDTVRVEPGVALSEVAQAAGVPTNKLESLNPHYRVARTPPAEPGKPAQSWLVRVPSGKGVSVSQRLAKSSGEEELSPYSVRFGDTLATIAARFRTTEDRLRQVNRVGRQEVLAAGTVLLVPELPVGELPGTAVGDEVVVVPPRQFEYNERRRVFYRVLPGDTLARVAQALGVTRAELLTWNALDTSARLQSNMVLQAYVPKDASLEDVRYLTEEQTRVLVAGTDEFFDYFEALNGRRRMLVTVKDGDTLQSIGKRHGMTVGWMERINRKSRSDKLRAGETVVVYTQRDAGARPMVSDNSEPRPLGPVEPPRPDALPGSEPAGIASDQATTHAPPGAERGKGESSTPPATRTEPPVPAAPPGG